MSEMAALDEWLFKKQMEEINAIEEYKHTPEYYEWKKITRAKIVEITQEHPYNRTKIQMLIDERLSTLIWLESPDIVNLSEHNKTVAAKNEVWSELMNVEAGIYFARKLQRSLF